MSVFDGLQSVLGSVFGTDMSLTRASTGTTVTVTGIFETIMEDVAVADGRGNAFAGPVAHLQKDEADGVAPKDSLVIDGATYRVLWVIPPQMDAVDAPLVCLLEVV